MSDATVSFERIPCSDCNGTGELRIDSENINEQFVIEKQTVITEYSTCLGLGFKPPSKP